MNVLFKSFSVFIVLLTGLSNAASIAMEEETLHLLDYIGQSGCTFTRNGTEYSSEEARSHILRKYNYVKSKISTTEQVIKYAATKSSISGKAYTITCPGEEPVPSAEWLSSELLKYRLAK
ncbi:MAG: DUF5329 domain-containing protein [Proteobacteria bacterium]|nr:DUF5329 domain-containing protein [Pseudomonadota bacterium]